MWLGLLSLSLLLGVAFCEEDSSEYGKANVMGKRSTNCTCGLSNKSSNRIIGGTEAQVNEYPLIAGLVSPRTMFLFCGGAIISEWHVLTAAHCTVPMKERQIAVTLGDHIISKKDETPGTVLIYVEKTIEHEEYNRLAQHNDIALVVLTKKIPFSKYIGRACLPTEPFNADKVRVIGWGRTSADGSGSDTLLKVDLDIQPIEKCAKSYPIRTNVVRQFCTYTQGKDSCKGDSGGPLIHLDKETNRYTVVGLVSYGKSCAGRLGGVNTDVYAYLDWISSHMEEGKTCSKV